MNKKSIHKQSNWRIIHLREVTAGSHTPRRDGIMYRNCPVDKDGNDYPPIMWSDICRGFTAAKSDMSGCLPQLFLAANNKVVGVVQEICSKYEHGIFRDYDDDKLDDIKTLVCAVHGHLGSSYETFAETKFSA